MLRGNINGDGCTDRKAEDADAIRRYLPFCRILANYLGSSSSSGRLNLGTLECYSLCLKLVASCSFLFVAFTSALLSQIVHSPSPEPDDRFKADILVVVAHPDDEGMAVGYLAKAIFDQHKRVAVVYGTRGDGGGNSIGMETASALGAVREMEARRADAAVGINNVWFLGAPDTPGQNVLRSLETWNHGSSLGQVVRLVRLTRPDVIMTWLPVYSAGENHGDHQAASVIANEAFDLAGDPTSFAEQVSPAADHAVSGNLTEGMHPWQPKKLYFFSDTANPSALDGKGPQYPWDEMSPSKNVTYGWLALESIANHRTQGYPGLMAVEALKQPDLGALKQMRTRLVLGKSLVGGDVTGDVFQGVAAGAIAFKRPHGYEAEATNGLSAELGGPWAFYRQFHKAHDLPHVGEIFQPEAKVSTASEAHIPILLHNNTATTADFDVTALGPESWGKFQGTGHYSVRPNETESLTLSLPTPATPAAAQEIKIAVKAASATVAEFRVNVSADKGGLPQ